MPAIHIQVNLHVKRWVRVKSCVHAANRQFPRHRIDAVVACSKHSFSICSELLVKAIAATTSYPTVRTTAKRL